MGCRVDERERMWGEEGRGLSERREWVRDRQKQRQGHTEKCRRDVLERGQVSGESYYVCVCEWVADCILFFFFSYLYLFLFSFFFFIWKGKGWGGGGAKPFSFTVFTSLYPCITHVQYISFNYSLLISLHIPDNLLTFVFHVNI